MRNLRVWGLQTPPYNKTCSGFRFPALDEAGGEPTVAGDTL